jgi:glycosyltransferase involved in cell wall biosynthesis
VCARFSSAVRPPSRPLRPRWVAAAWSAANAAMRQSADTLRPAETGLTRSIPTVEVVMPAHNEGESIAATIREFQAVARDTLGVSVRFVVSEDGSTDDTCEVIRRLGLEMPVHLLSYPERKGYSRAVVDGMRQTTADVVCFVDSDGQCDPRDLGALLERLDGSDLVVGFRHPRRDSLFRRAISRAFGTVYRALFPVRVRDPSCPYVVISRDALATVLTGSPGVLKQGFWWEFNARAFAHGLRVAEVPVRHRRRAAGETQVYRLRKIPRIAYEHVLGLFALRRELRLLRAG